MLGQVTTEQQPDYLALDDEQLLAQCTMQAYKASGPGGQHRNKVSSAVRLVHEPTGVTAHGNESRSQHDNKRVALKRLRMHLATELRRPVDQATVSPDTAPEVVRSCMFEVRGGPSKGKRKLDVGRKDRRFWAVAQYLLDVLTADEARLGDTAKRLGISTGNLVSVLKTDRHLWAATQQLRQKFGQKPLQ